MTKKSRSTVPWPIVAAAVALAGCGPADRAPEWAGTVTDSAGIRVVHNPEQGLWCADDEWTFTDALLIGAEGGDPAYEFGKITSIQVSPDGSIFVFDPLASEVRVFDPGGMHVRTFGRRGKGPGEFGSAAAGIFLMDDGQLLVPDIGNGRINRMSPDGEFLGSVPASYAGGFPVRWDGAGDGSLVVQRRAMGMNEDPDLETGDPLVRIAPDGSETTLVIMPKAKTVWMEGNAPRFRYFETEPSWDLGPSGTLRTGMTQEYRIALRGGDGVIRTILTRPSPPRAVTDADKFRYETLLREALTRTGISPDAVQRQIDRLSFGTTFPAFNQVMEGPDGTTLVQRIGELSEMERLDLSEEQSRRMGSSTWDVFDADGRFLGPIDLPSRFTPMVWQTAVVHGRWLDDQDVAHVRSLNIVPGARSPGEPCR